MSFPGDHHVLVAIDTDADLAAGLGRGQGGERGEHRSLGFFSAETAAHARAFDYHAVHRQVEQVRDDVLDLGWMLGRRTDEDRAVFPSLGPGCVGLEIEMVLAAERELAFQRSRRSLQGCGYS